MVSFLLSFPAGSHAEHSTVRKEDRIVTPKTMGWYLKPAMPAWNICRYQFNCLGHAKVEGDSQNTAKNGGQNSTTASCIRQVRICPGEAPHWKIYQAGVSFYSWTLQMNLADDQNQEKETINRMTR